MITTQEIQALSRPLLEQVFAAVGHDLVIVRPGKATGAWGADGRKPQAADTPTPVRGLLMPADGASIRAATEAGLPVPKYVAYLPFGAPVDTPGWHLEIAGPGGDPIAYYPKGDARDEGGQGVVWVVTLGAPGERSK